SNEYLVKARLRTTFYDQPNRFAETREHFESALNAVRTPSAIFGYALFLENHNEFKRAMPLYEEALRIYRELAEENPRTYLPYVAGTLNNLAILQSAQNNYELAAQSNEEALLIRRELAEKNPRTYLPDVAMTLNNLAILQSGQNNNELATLSYEEALSIYRELAEENPRTYLPDVAETLVNLSIFYLQAKPDKAKLLALVEEMMAIELAEEVIAISQDFPNVPAVQQYADIVGRLLQMNKGGKENGET
ncbi:MAG: tetratricopeptide repeat protein, partial [Cyanobacteria bacterium J06553_1]